MHRHSSTGASTRSETGPTTGARRYTEGRNSGAATAQSGGEQHHFNRARGCNRHDPYGVKISFGELIMDTLTLFSIHGTILIGKRDGDKLREPRRLVMTAMPQNPNMTVMGLQELPGSPAFVVVKDYGFYYPVKDEGIVAVYVKATTGIELPISNVGKNIKLVG